MLPKPNLKVVDGTRNVFLPQTMLETVQVSISDRQRRIFQIIDKSADWEKVKAKVKEEMGYQGYQPTGAYLDEGILSLKQYYAVCFLDDNPHAISDTLDPFWHAHILHTNRYFAFCEDVGIDYMHHRPRDYSNPNEVPVIKRLYVHTHNMFCKCFAYVSPIFMAKYEEETQLVCTHYTQNHFVQPGDIAEERIPELMQLETTLEV